jgi:hypothetical protein
MHKGAATPNNSNTSSVAQQWQKWMRSKNKDSTVSQKQQKLLRVSFASALFAGSWDVPVRMNSFP